jgi:hypothetical protein
MIHSPVYYHKFITLPIFNKVNSAQFPKARHPKKKANKTQACDKKTQKALKKSKIPSGSITLYTLSLLQVSPHKQIDLTKKTQSQKKKENINEFCM